MYRAGLPMPGARLLAAAGLVRRGGTVADIGCDHGKLAVYLAKSGHACRVIAVDVNPMPLAKARALVQQAGCGGLVQCRLGDGLDALAPDEAQDIVVAGLSGETIAALLGRVSWVRNGRLNFVFVPAARPNWLRRWLLQNGFAIRAETPVEEKGKFYTTMQAVYTGQNIACPDAFFCEVGLVPQSPGPAAQGYLKGRLAHLCNQGKAPLAPTEKAGLDALVKEVEECLQLMK